MNREELFKKNFPEYVTEKGMCLSPYWDLFSAGIECAAKENAELKSIADFQTSSNMDRYFQLKRSKEQLVKAKEIILKLYNAGRDVLMCRTEEKVYDNLSDAINDRSIEQFLEEVSE